MGYGYDIPPEVKETFSIHCGQKHHADCKGTYKVKVTGKPCACDCHKEES